MPKYLSTSCTTLVCLLVILFTGCNLQSSLGNSSHGQGPLAIMGTLASVPDRPVTEAHITMSRGKHLFEWTVPVEGLDFCAEVELPVGTWELSILLLDSHGTVLFKSEPQSVEVSPNGSQVVNVTLRPGDGKVNLTIDLRDSLLLPHARRARVYFDDERTELIWEEEKETINHVFSLPPGTYDFLVELYTESFRASDRLVPGLWQSVEVKPGEELIIHWEPLMQSMTIEAIIGLVPDPPQNLTAEVQNSQVKLIWDTHASPYVTGYFVYCQADPFERPEILTPTPVTTTEFIHVLDDLEELPYDTLTYSVAALSGSGVVGYRCDEIKISIEK